MIIHGSDQMGDLVSDITNCDRCDRTRLQGVSFSKGYAIIAQGATGRYCEVMWFCDTCGKEQLRGKPSKSAEEARKWVKEEGDGWAEF